MSVKAFIDFIELRTKVGSVIPCLLGLAFSSYYFEHFNLLNSVLYFIALVLIDMFTTGWNNYNDFRLAKDKITQIETSAIGRSQINLQAAKLCLSILFFTAVLLGAFLVVQTNLLMLLMSGGFILIGILYTYGPFPISRLPFGELLSGLVLGFGNFFLAVYVNDGAKHLLALTFDGPTFSLIGNWLNILRVFVASLPTTLLIANMMFINNICDYEVDLENGRHTLISYTGKSLGIRFYCWNMMLSYAVIVLGIIWHLYPLWALLTFISLPILYRNGQKLTQDQSKRRVFGTAVQNLIAFNSLWLLSFGIARVFK